MMTSSARAGSPGREFEFQMRDERYLEVARHILREEGLNGLTISRVAQEMGFSKVTVYQRFGSREELLLELAIRCRQEMFRLMERASRIPVPPRLQVEAVGESIYHYSQRYAGNVQILWFTHSNVILSKAPKTLRAKLEDVGRQIHGVLLGRIEAGLACGDLVLPQDMSPQAVAHFFWAVAVGWAQTRCAGAVPLNDVESFDTLKTVNTNLRHLFDAYGWRPLSSEHDFEELSARTLRVLAEVDISASLEAEHAPPLKSNREIGKN